MLQRIGVLVLSTILLSSCFTEQVETTAIPEPIETQIEQTEPVEVNTPDNIEEEKVIDDEEIEELENILLDLIEDEA